MNPIIEYLTGMDALTDQIVAMDLLNSAKAESETMRWRRRKPERLK